MFLNGKPNVGSIKDVNNVLQTVIVGFVTVQEPVMLATRWVILMQRLPLVLVLCGVPTIVLVEMVQ